MKVKCKFNNLGELKGTQVYEFVKRQMRYEDDIELDFERHKEYHVYGIEFRDNYPYFYLLSEDRDEYPTPNAACFFEITDARLSKHWELVYKYDPPAHWEFKQGRAFLLADDWAKDPMFYELLLEGEEPYVEKFKEIRKMIEVEYFVK